MFGGCLKVGLSFVYPSYIFRISFVFVRLKIGETLIIFSQKKP